MSPHNSPKGPRRPCSVTSACRCLRVSGELDRRLGELGLFLSFPVDIRFSAREDDVWLSPAYGRDVAWVGIPSKRPHGKETAHAETFALFESVMLKYDGRTHWAKQHTCDGRSWNPFAFSRGGAACPVAPTLHLNLGQRQFQPDRLLCAVFQSRLCAIKAVRADGYSELAYMPMLCSIRAHRCRVSPDR